MLSVGCTSTVTKQQDLASRSQCLHKRVCDSRNQTDQLFVRKQGLFDRDALFNRVFDQDATIIAHLASLEWI